MSGSLAARSSHATPAKLSSGQRLRAAASSTVAIARGAVRVGAWLSVFCFGVLVVVLYDVAMIGRPKDINDDDVSGYE